MELNFDAQGYLFPYTVIECDMATLETYFIDAFPLSETRHKLWLHYQQYVNDLQHEVSEHFIQWLDGSFLTQALNPKDIDMITFIDAQVFQDKEAILEKYWSFALEDKGLDAYLVENYSPDSKQYNKVTENFRNVWHNRFGKDRNGKPKGFIQISW